MKDKIGICGEECSMTTFDEREHAYEAKFAHDEELLFRAEARRNRLVGTWAAGLMGIEGEDVFRYVKELIRVDFQEPGDEDVIRKLMSDLEGRATEDEIRSHVAASFAEAKRQLHEEGA